MKKQIISISAILVLIAAALAVSIWYINKGKSNDNVNNAYDNTQKNTENSSKTTESNEDPMFTFYAFDEKLPLNMTVDEVLKKGWYTQIDHTGDTQNPGDALHALTVEKDGERERTGRGDGLNLYLRNSTDKEQSFRDCTIYGYASVSGSDYNISLGNGIRMHSSTLEEVEEKCGIPTEDIMIYKSKDGRTVGYTYYSKDGTTRLVINCKDGKVSYIALAFPMGRRAS